ncbi:hypothetical protein [Dysgonomonas sp. 25]|uniref:hypothetical protein n=1 Tax=Dysgonomonas sp. 25 TaxID=2302933 RepID=UPI0013D89565|nr:hypothetical protein [Dysgonomonas sp. 25]
MMKYFIYIFFNIILFSSCVQNKSIKKELLLNQANIKEIVERVEIMIFVDGNYSENIIIEINDVKGVMENRTFYNVDGCAEYFYKSGSEGFILYALVDKEGYLRFDEKMKNYCVELRRDENIIIDKHNTVDTIRGFVVYEKQKIMVKICDYNKLMNSSKDSIEGQRMVIYVYK